MSNNPERTSVYNKFKDFVSSKTPAFSTPPETTQPEQGIDYKLFQNEFKRREMVEVCSRVADYLKNNEINNVMLVDRSARPAYIGIKAAWKRKYKDIPSPNIYFVNPTGFIDFEEALRQDSHTRLFKQKIEDKDQGEFYDAHLKEFIPANFEETYEKLSTHKDEPILLFDNCIHSGRTIKPIIENLRQMEFSDVRIGVVDENLNKSGINPDFVAFDYFDPNNGRCYIFGKDRMVETKFGSVASSPAENPDKIERSIRLRKEMLQIFQESPDEWFGIENSPAQ